MIGSISASSGITALRLAVVTPGWRKIWNALPKKKTPWSNTYKGVAIKSYLRRIPSCCTQIPWLPHPWGLNEMDFRRVFIFAIVRRVFSNAVHRSSETAPIARPVILQLQIFNRNDGSYQPFPVSLRSALSLRMLIRYSDREVNIRSDILLSQVITGEIPEKTYKALQLPWL